MIVPVCTLDGADMNVTVAPSVSRMMMRAGMSESGNPKGSSLAEQLHQP